MSQRGEQLQLSDRWLWAGELLDGTAHNQTGKTRQQEAKSLDELRFAPSRGLPGRRQFQPVRREWGELLFLFGSRVSHQTADQMPKAVTKFSISWICVESVRSLRREIANQTTCHLHGSMFYSVYRWGKSLVFLPNCAIVVPISTLWLHSVNQGWVSVKGFRSHSDTSTLFLLYNEEFKCFSAKPFFYLTK